MTPKNSRTKRENGVTLALSCQFQNQNPTGAPVFHSKRREKKICTRAELKPRDVPTLVFHLSGADKQNTVNDASHFELRHTQHQGWQATLLK